MEKPKKSERVCVCALNGMDWNVITEGISVHERPRGRTFTLLHIFFPSIYSKHRNYYRYLIALRWSEMVWFI